MRFLLKKISGIDDAILSLKFSKRSYNSDIDAQVRRRVHKFSDRNGFITEPNIVTWVDNNPECVIGEYDVAAINDWSVFKRELDMVAKWGAGVGFSAMREAGHETLLRMIDFTVVVEGLHRAGQDDLDSHAMRMNNRIVRSSSRLTTAGATELSDWYKDKVIPFSRFISDIWWMKDEFKNHSEALFPDEIKYSTGDIYIKTQSGYVRKDLANDKDALRGLYPLGMSSDCIFKISFHDLRHMYMRRNMFTHAAPELQDGIEQLASQVEEHLPTLGLLIRNDYCSDGELHHIMDIEKTYVGDDRSVILNNK